MIKDYCWKCKKESFFKKSTVTYVCKKTGGRTYACIECTEKFYKKNNIKRIIRTDKKDTGSPFNDFKFEYLT